MTTARAESPRSDRLRLRSAAHDATQPGSAAPHIGVHRECGDRTGLKTCPYVIRTTAENETKN
jgi:hypothetical protein